MYNLFGRAYPAAYRRYVIIHGLNLWNREELNFAGRLVTGIDGLSGCLGLVLAVFGVCLRAWRTLLSGWVFDLVWLWVVRLDCDEPFVPFGSAVKSNIILLMEKVMDGWQV